MDLYRNPDLRCPWCQKQNWYGYIAAGQLIPSVWRCQECQLVITAYELETFYRQTLLGRLCRKFWFFVRRLDG